MRDFHVRWQHEKKNYEICTTFYFCYDDLVFDSCPVEVYRWYHSCLLLSKILQAISLKPQPLRSVWNIRTTQRFLAINNTYSLTSNVFLEIVQNLDNNALSASICSCKKKFLSTWSMFCWTKAHLLIGSTVSRDQFALSLNLGIWIVFTVTQQKNKLETVQSWSSGRSQGNEVL